MKPCKTVELGGKARPIRLGFKAILGIEAETKKPLAEVGASGMMSDIVTILYHALVAGANYVKDTISFTKKDVEDWLDQMDSIEEISNLIAVAITDSMPKADASEEGASTEGK